MRSLGLAMEQETRPKNAVRLRRVDEENLGKRGLRLQSQRFAELAEGGEPTEEPTTIAKGLQSLFR